jgi:hypothetical protein
LRERALTYVRLADGRSSPTAYLSSGNTSSGGYRLCALRAMRKVVISDL